MFLGVSEISKIYAGTSEVSKIYLGVNEVWSGMDPDAKAFIDTTGATDTLAIVAWVVGIKNLGLWEDLVCWPLISTQNYGSGGIVESLGGYVARPATLTGPYAWTTNGFVCENNSGILASISPTISFAPNTTQINIIRENLAGSGVGVTVIQGTSLNPYLGLVVNGLRGISHRGTNLGGSRNYPARSINNFNFLGAMIGSADHQLVSNATYSSVFIQALATSSQFNIVFRSPILTVLTGNITHAMSILFPSRKLTQTEIQAVRTLYKSTLGAGLTLP
jgi:hypothetical protein